MKKTDNRKSTNNPKIHPKTNNPNNPNSLNNPSNLNSPSNSSHSSNPSSKKLLLCKWRCLERRKGWSCRRCRAKSTRESTPSKSSGGTTSKWRRRTSKGEKWRGGGWKRGSRQSRT